jgi:DNA-binding transcriptional MerR regulator
MARLYYSISEVSKIVDEEQHILRYWEKEFDQLTPRKRTGGNRAYSDKDIAIIKIIKKLLREEMLSLKGAREKLRTILEEHKPDELFPSDGNAPVINDTKPHPAVKPDSGELKRIYDYLAEVRDILRDA